MSYEKIITPNKQKLLDNVIKLDKDTFEFKKCSYLEIERMRNELLAQNVQPIDASYKQLKAMLKGQVSVLKQFNQIKTCKKDLVFIAKYLLDVFQYENMIDFGLYIGKKYPTNFAINLALNLFEESLLSYLDYFEGKRKFCFQNSFQETAIGGFCFLKRELGFERKRIRKAIKTKDKINLLIISTYDKN